MSLVSRLRPVGPSGFGYHSTADAVTADLDLTGKQYLITGVASGLGRETSRVLLRRGATVWGTARTADRARQGAAGVAGDFRPLACDLTDLSQVRRVAWQLGEVGAQLDGIIANAGIMALPSLEKLAGYEMQYMVNHVAHFVLVTSLLSRLGPQGRVVVVSSQAHRAAPRGGIDFDNLDGSRGYHPWRAYARSKLANLLFVRALARRLPAGQTANAVHPGVIQTGLGRHLPAVASLGWSLAAPVFFKTVEQGAATQCFVATRPELAGLTGRYFSDCNERRSSRAGQDRELAERLYQHTEELVADLSAAPARP